MRRAPLLLALAALAALPATAAGQAWLRWDQSAAAAGAGGAVAAVADDASAVFHNPAGIAALFGTHVRVDATAASRGGEFHGFDAASFERERELALEGGIYLTHAMATDLTLGVSLNTPWGASVEWERPAEFAGRFRATGASLRSIALSPVLAWQAHPRLSVAVGPVFTYAVLELDRFEQDPELSALGGGGPIALARSHYELDGLAAGWVAGVAWRIDDVLSVAAHVRDGAAMELVGPVDFQDVAPAELRDFAFPGEEGTVGEILDARFVDQEATARLPLPTVVTAGAAWAPIEVVRLTADVQWLEWGAEGEAIPIDFVDEALDDRQALGYERAWALRGGVEIRHRPGRLLRLGFAHEESPAPSGASNPLAPDSDRNSVSAGVGFTWRTVAIDLAYRVAFLADREGVALPGDPSPDGVFESTEHRWTAGISRRF